MRRRSNLHIQPKSNLISTSELDVETTLFQPTVAHWVKVGNINFICASNLVDSVTVGKVIATDLASMFDVKLNIIDFKGFQTTC